MKDNVEIEIKVDATQAKRELRRLRKSLFWLSFKNDWSIYLLIVFLGADLVIHIIQAFK